VILLLTLKKSATVHCAKDIIKITKGLLYT